MGMFNRVYKRCPECGNRACIQIAQVEDGFGNFNLDTKEYLNELNEDQIEHLEDLLEDEEFICNKCHNWFKANIT